MDVNLLRFFALAIIGSLEEVHCSHCDTTFYSPVSDCTLHPLRVGYYASPACGSLHFLSDSADRPNARFARLDYTTGSDSYYHEYSAGEYLKISLEKPAYIRGIAVQGSPKNSRYYLKSMEVWYKITINNMNVGLGATTNEGYYKEAGETKRFIDDMRATTKFNFVNPFFADEVRVYPITFHEDKVFRVELYGCYLGKISLPSSVGMKSPVPISIKKSQDQSLESYSYYIRITEPNGTMSLLNANASRNYTFLSRGKGIVELGLNHSTGWISTDKIKPVVQGPILGLEMKIDASSISPFTKNEGQDIEFYLGTSDQPYQIKSYHFSFGDGSSISYNYPKHKYNRGLYNATGIVQNDFFSANVTRTLVICPITTPSVHYRPLVSSAITFEYVGPAGDYTVTSSFYALHHTVFKLFFDSSEKVSHSVYAAGNTEKQYSVAGLITAPSNHTFMLKYTDRCGSTDGPIANLYVDEKITGVTITVNQTFKASLVEQVSYFFRNHPIDFYIDISNGTTVTCNFFPGMSVTTIIKDKKLKGSNTYTVETSTSVYATCDNRLSMPVISNTISLQLKEVPETMLNFSLELSDSIVKAGDSLYLLLIFKQGNEMSCNVTSVTAAISRTLAYSDLLPLQESHGSGGKAYRIGISTGVFSLNHRIDAACRNVISQVKGNITLQVQEAVSVLSLRLPSFLCYNRTLNVLANATKGRPLHKAFFINSVKYLDFYSASGAPNVFSVNSSSYGVPGWKQLKVRAWNDVSNVESFASVRIATNTTSVSVVVNFTMSSYQALGVRPDAFLPARERINFTAVVKPVTDGLIYNWSINGNMTRASTSLPHWDFNFTRPGSYLVVLAVDGCNDTVYQQWYTVLEPVLDFAVNINPHPVVLVNASVFFNITIPANSYCMKSFLGVGNTMLSECRRDSLSDPFCNFTSSTCQRVMAYNRSGNYSLNFTASNPLYARIKTVTLVAKACYDPKFALQGNGTAMESYVGGAVEQVLRSRPLDYSVMSLNITCELVGSYTIDWSVRGGMNSSTIFPHSKLQIKNMNKTMRVSCCSLDYGLVVVTVTVSMVGNKLINGLFTKSEQRIAYVNDTDIVVTLTQNRNRSYPYNSTISLDASNSYDPDNYTKSLSFTWFCRDTVLEPRDIFTIPDIPVINSTSFLPKATPTGSMNASASTTTNFPLHSSVVSNRTNTSSSNGTRNSENKTSRGCFGQPFGRLDVSNSTKTITFNSAFLQENHSLVFVVVVEGASSLRLRRSVAKQNIFVKLRETPYFELRCSENCARKVDPTEKLTIMVVCQSESCKKRANFKWSMAENGLPVSLSDKIYSSLTEKDLYAKPNVFMRGYRYKLTLTGTAYDGAKYEQVLSFLANEPPKNGTCNINPSHGVAIHTDFNISCTGWLDTDQPLRYEVSHYTKVLLTVVCRKTDDSCNTILPVGDEKNSSVYVRIRVLDSLGMFTELYFVVKVTASPLSWLDIDRYLRKVVNGTDGEKALQLIGAVASVLNWHKAENKTSKYVRTSVKFREASARILVRMVNSSSDDVIAPVIATIAKMPSEFSLKAGILATEAITRMADKFVIEQVNVIFRDIVDRSKSLLAAIGMVSKSTSVNLDPNKVKRNETNETDADYLLWEKDEGRKIILNNSLAFDKIANSQFSRMSPFDGEISVPTENLGLLLKKSFAAQLNKSSSLLIMDNKITLPSLEKMNIDYHYIISSLMKVTSFNPYFWTETSKLINSTMTMFLLKSNEAQLAVKNTKEPIEFQIKRNLERPIPFQHWRFQQRANQERVNYHVFSVRHDNSLHLEFKPMNYCIDYDVYIKYGSRPSRDDYYKNWTLPDLSTCNDTGQQEALKANICAIYKDVIAPSLQYPMNEWQDKENCSLKAVLEKRIKDALKICSSDPYKVFLPDSESKNGNYFIGIFQTDASIFRDTMPAYLYNSSSDCQVTDAMNQSSYFLRGYSSKCRFWAPSQTEDWQTQGCQVGKMTDPSVVYCRCNHLTSFAADFFIAPNPIDIDKVIEGFKNIKDNLSVVILISLLCGFYILLGVYLRRKDKKDSEKVTVAVLDDEASKPFEYLLVIVTGARFNAGTTAHVFCCLNSETTLGEPRLLFDPEKASFQRDAVNAFKISFSEPVGDVIDIRLWHDNTGDSPGWFLSRVYLEDLQTNKRSLFICESWLAVELEDGLIDRILPVAGHDEQQQFSHIFTTKAATDFSDQHLWLSLALKRPHDTFSRVQRLTCCMSLLSTTMLASAMFFQLGNNSKYIWKIGSLVIDFKGIIIGIQSGFVVIPVNFVIAWVFRNSESLEHHKKRSAERRLNGIHSKRIKRLPFGFVIVAWFLAIASICASLVVVLFYSMQWGNDTSQQFVLSILTSFVQSAFLIQPIKLAIVAMILAFILKKGYGGTDILDRYKYSGDEKEIERIPIEIDLSKLQTSPLTAEQLSFARKRRSMEIRLKLFVQDFLSYLLFLTLLVLVVRGHRDPGEYFFRKTLEDVIVHKHFQEMKDVPGLWTWVQHHFIPAIYSQQWYNGENFTNFKMLENQEAYRIGLARIRQLRIKPGSCKVYEDMVRYFNSCQPFYTLSMNEERKFDVGWKDFMASRKRRSLQEKDNAAGSYEERSMEQFGKESPNQSFENRSNYFASESEDGEVLKRTRRALKFKIKRKTIPSTSLIKHPDVIPIDEEYLLPNGLVKPNKQNWIYHDMSSLRGFPYYGHFATYSGGGYVASLSTDIDFARATAMALEQDSWVDVLTRALFFEFSVYNANLNFFATGFVIVEILPTGSIVPNANIRVFKLYRYVGVFGKVVMASEIILVLCLLFFVYKECRHMYRLGWAYFKLFWSWVEITIAVALFTAIILRAFSWYEADKNLMKLRQNTEQFINFHYTVVADDALLVSITVICFASTLKCIKLLAIFPTFLVLKETIYRFASPLANYALPFLIAFFGFATLGYLMFNSEALFSSYANACQTQLLMLIGGSVYYALRQAHEVLGPLFFLMFAAFETCILLNIFLGIINDSIKESSDWKTEARSNDFVDFVENRIRSIFNLKPVMKGPRRHSRGKSLLRNSTSKRSTDQEPLINELSPSNGNSLEKFVPQSPKRRVTFSESLVPDSRILKASIREIFGSRWNDSSRRKSYYAGEENPEGTAEIAANGGKVKTDKRRASKGSFGKRKHRVSQMELLLKSEEAKMKMHEAFDRCTLNLDALKDWMEKSTMDESIDVKLDLKVFHHMYH